MANGENTRNQHGAAPEFRNNNQVLSNPAREGYRNAGFFELDKVIYSHYCDSHGNMVRIKFNEEKKSWEKYKYETFGCVESKG